MKLFSFMSVSIKLTKKGEANIEKILSHVFSYINMLKQKGVQKWIFDEIKLVRELQFQFLEK
jgi:insulysin